MIGIKVGDTNADIYKDTKISLELNNPNFNEDNLSPGSLSLPFDIPVAEESPLNNDLFEVPDLVENTKNFGKKDATLFFNDLPLKKGKLQIQGVKDRRATANFTFGLRTLSEEIATKKLRDIMDEGIAIHSLAIPKKIYVKPSEVIANYNIEVNGRNYQGASLNDLAIAINADETEPRAVASYVDSGATWLGMAAPYIELSPYNFPNNLLSPLSVRDPGAAATISFFWLAHGFDPTAYSDAYNDFLTDNAANPKFRFPPLRNNDPYGESVKAEFYGNPYNNVPPAQFGFLAGGTKVTNKINVIGLVNDPNYSYTQGQARMRPLNVNSYQPIIRLPYVLQKISEYFGFGYEGDFLTLPDVDNMVLHNTALLDEPMDYIGSMKYVFFRSSFNLAELVPDVTVRDFFLLLQSRYNLGVSPNENTGNLRIVLREQIARRYQYTDITQKCASNKYEQDLSLTGIRLSCERESTNGLHTDDSTDIDVPEITLEVKAKSMLAIDEFIVSQKQGSKFGLVIFYNKLILGNNVASGSGSAWVEILGDDNGIYQHFWKYWLFQQQQRKSLTLSVDFSIQDLRNLNWELKHRFDRRDYLIKKINVEIVTDIINQSSVQFYTM